ncbi:hypothetical protein RRG08_006652 [Elysia crispata]|uniref:Ig-like domain-containing protein n=1 Tax=Elysia crispata TaxID=231223 RepID=A0AAE0YVH7_9GAST|nr:hypothetical protein RRG08_006652 [Elysia crispata]
MRKPIRHHPIFLDTPSLITHEEGDTAVLFCSVSNLGDHTVSWRRLPNPSPLTIGPDSWTQDPRVQAEHVPNSSQWNLVIERVSVADAGQYECQVSRRRTLKRQMVTLIVREKPVAKLPRIEISGDNLIRIGSRLSLVCNATLLDVSAERVAWWKDGQPLTLDNEDRFKVHTRVSSTGFASGVISSKLELKDARVTDSGVYLCRSTERAQMAGVKVEVQGESTLKRADEGQGYADAPRVQVTEKLTENGAKSATDIFSYSICVITISCQLLTALPPLFVPRDNYNKLEANVQGGHVA